MSQYGVWFQGLRGRLMGLLGGAIFVILILNVVLFVGLMQVNSALDEITAVRMPSLKGLEQMNNGQASALLSLERYLSAHTSQEKLAEAQSYKAQRDLIKKGWDLYEPLPQSAEEAIKWKELVPIWHRWESGVDKVFELAQAGRNDEAEAYLKNEIRTYDRQADEALDAVIRINYQIAEADKADAVRASHFMKTASSAAATVGGLFLMIFGLILASRISEALASLAARLRTSSAHVSSAATQIASAAEQLSQTTTQQASSLAETTSALAEMTSTVAANSDNAQGTADMSSRSQQSALRGKQVMQEMVHSMGDIDSSNQRIAEQIARSNERIGEIIKVIGEIGTKTKVINEIVFQTKLLSFNASVEAARAGEQGKGFAVVAEEVGNLARVSGNAADEISKMLAASIQNVEQIVSETKSSVSTLIDEGRIKIEHGTRIATECSQVLEDIVKSVEQVSAMAAAISNSSREQTQGIDEINKAMNQIDQVTQQNASSSHEAASASQELSSQAEQLRTMVDELVKTVEGQSPKPFETDV